MLRKVFLMQINAFTIAKSNAKNVDKLANNIKIPSKYAKNKYPQKQFKYNQTLSLYSNISKTDNINSFCQLHKDFHQYYAPHHYSLAARHLLNLIVNYHQEMKGGKNPVNLASHKVKMQNFLQKMLSLDLKNNDLQIIEEDLKGFLFFVRKIRHLGIKIGVQWPQFLQLYQSFCQRLFFRLMRAPNCLENCTLNDLIEINFDIAFLNLQINYKYHQRINDQIIYLFMMKTPYFFSIFHGLLLMQTIQILQIQIGKQRKAALFQNPKPIKKIQSTSSVGLFKKHKTVDQSKVVQNKQQVKSTHLSLPKLMEIKFYVIRMFLMELPPSLQFLPIETLMTLYVYTKNNQEFNNSPHSKHLKRLTIEGFINRLTVLISRIMKERGVQAVSEIKYKLVDDYFDKFVQLFCQRNVSLQNLKEQQMIILLKCMEVSLSKSKQNDKINKKLVFQLKEYEQLRDHILNNPHYFGSFLQRYFIKIQPQNQNAIHQQIIAVLSQNEKNIQVSQK